ncbi:MAG: CGNR zinc finger domain-containing protein [Ktedonobacteraceae bacterium]
MDSACLDFLNSEFRDFRGRWVEDRLQKPEWRAEFLTRWHLAVEDQPDERVLSELTELRGLLRRIVESLGAAGPLEADLALLNQYMNRTVPLPRMFRDGEAYQLEFVPARKDWNWVISEVAMSFADLLVHGDIRRVKICENTLCRWIFYDESKSRTRRYCSPEKCGNLLKLRRFRARHTSTKEATP